MFFFLPSRKTPCITPQPLKQGEKESLVALPLRGPFSLLELRKMEAKLKLASHFPWDKQTLGAFWGELRAQEDFSRTCADTYPSRKEHLPRAIPLRPFEKALPLSQPSALRACKRRDGTWGNALVRGGVRFRSPPPTASHVGTPRGIAALCVWLRRNLLTQTTYGPIYPSTPEILDPTKKELSLFFSGPAKFGETACRPFRTELSFTLDFTLPWEQDFFSSLDG